MRGALGASGPTIKAARRIPNVRWVVRRLGLALAALSCGRGGQGEGSPDGVEPSAERLPRAALTLERRLSLPESDVTGLSWLTVFKDGTIAIGLPGERAVGFLGMDLRYLGRVGRSGEGPGEFRVVGRHGRRGDTLWVDDPVRRRLVLLSSRGEFIGYTATPNAIADDVHSQAVPGKLTQPTIEGMLAGRQMVASASVRGSDGKLDGAVIGVLDGEGRLVRKAFRVPKDDCVVEASGSNWRGARVIPYCPRPLWSVTEGAERVVVAITLAPSEQWWRVKVVGVTLSGDPVFVRELRYPRIFVPERERSRVRDRATTVSRSGPIAAGSGSPPLSESGLSYPPIQSLLLGQDSTVWLLEYHPDAGENWLVLAPNGQDVGRIRLSGGEHLVAGGGGRIWVSQSADDGPESLAQFRLDWAAPEPAPPLRRQP